jgi:hypothetical protein
VALEAHEHTADKEGDCQPIAQQVCTLSMIDGDRLSRWSRSSSIVAIFVLAVALPVGAGGCGSKCLSVDGISLSESFSFDLLRPAAPPEGAGDASPMIDRIQVFEDKNVQCDMDAACRFKSLPLRAEFRDAKRIVQFMDAIRNDVNNGAAIDGFIDCTPRDTLYHIFLYHHEPNEIGYILVKPCAPKDQPERGMMTSYSADGDVSLRSAARTVQAIGAK